MQTSPLSLWWLRIATFALAAAAAASAAFWALKWTTLSAMRAEHAVTLSNFTPTDPLAVARLLGGGQTATALAPSAMENANRQLKLSGVIADPAIGGYALISVDGQPALPFRVGAKVNETLVLQSVEGRSAALGTDAKAPAAVTLELPKP